jgi:hypothetical protein
MMLGAATPNVTACLRRGSIVLYALSCRHTVWMHDWVPMWSGVLPCPFCAMGHQPQNHPN